MSPAQSYLYLRNWIKHFIDRTQDGIDREGSKLKIIIPGWFNRWLVRWFATIIWPLLSSLCSNDEVDSTLLVKFMKGFDDNADKVSICGIYRNTSTNSIWSEQCRLYSYCLHIYQALGTNDLYTWISSQALRETPIRSVRDINYHIIVWPSSRFGIPVQVLFSIASNLA